MVLIIGGFFAMLAGSSNGGKSMARAHSLSRILRFLSAGGPGVLLYYAILYTLTDLMGVWYLASAAIAFVANRSVTFALQKFWTFENRDTKNIHLQIGYYILLIVSLFVANLVLMYMLVEYVGLWYIWAQVIVTPLLTVGSYLASSRIFSNPVVA